MSEVSISDLNETLGSLNASAADELSQKYLLFISDGLDFGVNVSYVNEIITNYSITKLPLVPHYIKGILNLRGQVVPIIDIRAKMGKAEIDETALSCIIVLENGSVTVGIYVDTVSHVADIDVSRISPPSPHNRLEMVNGMVSLTDNKTLFLMDCDKLIEN